MKRVLLAILLFLVFSAPSNAAHIKGGFFTYEYLGPGSGTNNRYHITLTVYMLCSAQSNPGQLSNPINFSIFNAGNGQFLQDVGVSITNQYELGKVYDEPCISGNEIGCYYYIVVYDLASIELPSTPNGYTVAYQRCCRIAGINNLVSSGSVGNTFSINIPGSASVVPNAERNSSPVFLVNDTAVICGGSYFSYSFLASDKDGDLLTYEFCDAIEGANQNAPAPTTATNPPYFSVPYQSPYSGVQPMGSGVTINPSTGLISGIAPSALGEYVISVCVKEFRAGLLIGTTRKELHIKVGDCNPLRALLNPKPTTCDGYVVNFQNDAPGNPPGTEYFWDFGDPASGVNNTSIAPTPNHPYTDTGTYTVKLKVSLTGGLCTDSASFKVKVYPGFLPGFKVTGSCFQNPFQFTDTTKTSFGVVDSWSWNFGDLSSLADTSHIQNPQWTFSSAGPKTAHLIVTNSKGCTGTQDVTFDVLDKPVLTLAFRDTLICRESLQLNASGSGVFSWTPLINIINANTGTPTVTPTTTTTYYVTLDDHGCINKDSVRVRVVDFVTLRAINDTTICQGDVIQLGATSDGLHFNWTPVTNLDNPNIINPKATTINTTTYVVTATIGTCTAFDDVVVKTVPYPIADAGVPPTICYNTSGQLNARIVGIRFNWLPTSYLNNPNILNPISTPPRTTQYVLFAYDTLGCPKPGKDTVVVTVQPKIRAFAGNDTTVVVNQPLQFQGTGGTSYLWSPGTGLNSTVISNPVGVYNSSIDSVRYKLIVRDATGCADSAYVTVKVFKTNPSVFVPTAFTPNNDGLNDEIRPIAVGIQRINYFSVYNRWGQLVFTTTQNKKGWDGRINGRLQDSNVFVWMVSAVDYTGKSIFLKGTVALIR